MNKTFLTYTASDTPDQIRKCFDTYAQYLESVRHVFPAKAFAFAHADWHYKTDDSRCPHDAWLESLKIDESSIDKGRSKRSINIEARFLGAYHDGTLNVLYSDVHQYLLDKAPVSIHESIGRSHGDWLLDEMYLTDENLVVHNIEFANNANWTIHCRDVEYIWTPNLRHDATVRDL